MNEPEREEGPGIRRNDRSHTAKRKITTLLKIKKQVQSKSQRTQARQITKSKAMRPAPQYQNWGPGMEEGSLGPRIERKFKSSWVYAKQAFGDAVLGRIKEEASYKEPIEILNKWNDPMSLSAVKGDKMYLLQAMKQRYKAQFLRWWFKK